MSRSITDRLDDLQLATIRAKRAVAGMKSNDSEISGFAYDSALHHFALASEELNILRKRLNTRQFDEAIQEIVNLRNETMHEYFRVDGDEIIAAIDEDLVPLVEKIEQFYKNTKLIRRNA